MLITWGISPLIFHTFILLLKIPDVRSRLSIATPFRSFQLCGQQHFKELILWKEGDSNPRYLSVQQSCKLPA